MSFFFLEDTLDFVYCKHFTQNHNHLLAYAVCMVLFCLLCVKLQKIICLMLKYVWNAIVNVLEFSWRGRQ